MRHLLIILTLCFLGTVVQAAVGRDKDTLACLDELKIDLNAPTFPAFQRQCLYSCTLQKKNPNMTVREILTQEVYKKGINPLPAAMTAKFDACISKEDGCEFTKCLDLMDEPFAEYFPMQ